MRYQIVHTTTYIYDRPVFLEPHTLRLRSRSDGCQTLHNFSVGIIPQPDGVSPIIDLEGNTIIRAWFSQLTNHLSVKVTSEVETHCSNPFNYFLEPWAIKLPINYPTSTLTPLLLQPYLHPLGTSVNIDPAISELAREIRYAVDDKTDMFLTELNQQIYQNCQQEIRETGEPLPASITWQRKLGSCRDFTVVFMEACRSVGLAARFVSGYQEGDPDTQERHLHAWPEVYLPGAGWRGYDPTHGLVVSDRHIALVASAIPADAAPISGSIRGSGQSTMEYQLEINALN